MTLIVIVDKRVIADVGCHLHRISFIQPLFIVTYVKDRSQWYADKYYTVIQINKSSIFGSFSLLLIWFIYRQSTILKIDHSNGQTYIWDGRPTTARTGGDHKFHSSITIHQSYEVPGILTKRIRRSSYPRIVCGARRMLRARATSVSNKSLEAKNHSFSLQIKAEVWTAYNVLMA